MLQVGQGDARDALNGGQSHIDGFKVCILQAQLDIFFVSGRFLQVFGAVVGHDLAYPAMLTFVPAGWLGLIVLTVLLGVALVRRRQQLGRAQRLGLLGLLGLAFASGGTWATPSRQGAETIVTGLVSQVWAMQVLLKDPRGKAPWYNGPGVGLYVLGMMVAAFALRGLA